MNSFFSGNPLTLAYSMRHLRQRKVQVLMTVGGIALVVFVFVATLMLAQGLRQTLVSTGSYNNAIVIMAGAQNEVESGVTREQTNLLTTAPEVQQAEDGGFIATRDLVVLVTMKKRSDQEPSNVTVRGVAPAAWQVRQAVKLSAGRIFEPGTQEVIVGQAVQKKFGGTDLGDTIRLSGADWKVVGTFDAGNTAFSSEIWGDVDILMAAFRREQFSSVTFALRPGTDFEAMKVRLGSDPRLSVSVLRERSFYEEQSRDLANFIRYLGGFVSVVFSLGAIIGAMITMYSAVASRVREIGILRALGFSPGAIFSAFIKECLLLGLLGSLVGIALAACLTLVTFATTNFATFADVTFGFHLTPQIVVEGLLFSLVMSFISGALPAFRAARMTIVSSLRVE